MLAVLVGVAWLAAPAPSEARYGEDHGASLRALLAASDVAVLAEVLAGDGVLAPPWATYRVERTIVGAVGEGQTLRVVGPGRLPYLGTTCACGLLPSHTHEVPQGERVFLFLQRHLGGWAHTPVGASGVLAVERLIFSTLGPPEGLEEVFLEDLVALAQIQRTPAGPERDVRETAWLLDALRDPLTSERAADDLILNWRARPSIHESWDPVPDASDVRGHLSPAEERVLMDVLADRRQNQRIRADMAWLLARVPDPRVDELLRAELADQLAVAGFDPDTPAEQQRDPASTFPADEFPEYSIAFAYPLLAVIAQRADTPELRTRLQDYLDAELDEDQVRAARQFLLAWDG